MRYYNRYQEFFVNGQQTIVPFVKLPSKPTDKRYIYRVGVSRLDKISQQFYDTPYFGWIILMANPEFGGLENNIPDGTDLIIPFPLVNSLQDYKKALDTHFFYYGR
jgi:hypothetical protein